MQNEKPDLHIIGHWTYPTNTTKTMNVIANNVDSVELFVNNSSKGKITQPQNGYLYAFPNIAFTPGTIKAVGYKGGKTVAQQELKTAGAPAAIKLTLHTGPKGLRADGEDVALIDFEVVDAGGERCPTDEARVDFTWKSVGRTFRPPAPPSGAAATTAARSIPSTTFTSTPNAASTAWPSARRWCRGRSR